MNKSLVVIPTYNEVESIGALLVDLNKLPVDILVIDDGSPDGTAQLCLAHGVEVVSRSAKMGLGNAYRTGFAIALERGYSTVIEMDADGSHRVEDLKTMMEWIGQSKIGVCSANTYQRVQISMPIFCYP